MRVIAVVVHWRDIAETRGCLERLAVAGIEALVVDNGSPEPIGPEKSIADTSRTRRAAQSYSRSTTVEYRPLPAGVKSCLRKS